MNEQEQERNDEALLQRLNDPSTSLNDLTALIERDERLTTKLIDTANTALFGSRRKVANLKQAILLIGFRNVRRVLMEKDRPGSAISGGMEEGAGA